MATTSPSAERIAERAAAAAAHLPLVAILRGLRPHEAADAGHALYRAGFRLIEVPLNSPDPLASIASLRRTLPDDALIGAGTVLRVEQVGDVRNAGGEMAVMPNADPDVIRAAKAAGLWCLPGVVTPTEAFAALRAGADALKLFPTDLVSPGAVKAMRSVLPPGLGLYAVGGVTLHTMQAYRDAGTTGFGLGSALYTPGLPAAELAVRARAFAAAFPHAPSSTPRG